MKKYTYICVCMYIYIYIYTWVYLHTYTHVYFGMGASGYFPLCKSFAVCSLPHGSCCTAPGSEQAKCFTQQVKGSLLGVTNSYSGAFARHGIKT